MDEKIDERHLDSIRKKYKIFVEKVHKVPISERYKIYAEDKEDLLKVILGRNTLIEKSISEDHLLLVLMVRTNIFEEGSELPINIDDIVDGFINFLSSLPVKYIFKFPLNIKMDEKLNKINLTDKIWFERSISAPSPLKKVLNALDAGTSKDGVFFCIEQAGYFYKWFEGAGEKAISTFKRFIYLGLTKRIFALYGMANEESFKNAKAVYIDDNKMELSFELPANVPKLIANVEYYDPSKNNIIDESIRGRLQKELLVISSEDEYIGLNRAIDWGIEGIEREKDLNGFISTFIGIESILSQGLYLDRNSQDRLRDRCSYLLGKNVKQRDEVIKLFNEAYQLRRKIFHGIERKILAKDRATISNTELLLQRCISKEIEGLEV